MSVNTLERSEEARERRTDGLFRMRTANDWIREEKKRPMPRRLFGDLWLEGELAVMFADTGKGKSALAVQIADAIAGGRPIEPFESDAPPQTVLYFDFELTGKQFEMRYAEDADDGEIFLKNHYEFSDRFFRLEMEIGAAIPDDNIDFLDYLCDSIENSAVSSEAKVLIIDNITHLNRGGTSQNDAIRLMERLQAMKRRLSLSILVLAHTPKRALRRPISVNDLQGSKMLSNFADNIFAVGQSRHEESQRYIKHLKQRSSQAAFTSAHVPVFNLGKIDGNFLGLKFLSFTTEALTLLDSRDQREWDRIRSIKRLHDEGRNIREIGESFGISKSHAHRLLQMWSADADPSYRYEQYTRECERQRAIKAAHVPTPEELEEKRREQYAVDLATHNYMLSIGLKGIPGFDPLTGEKREVGPQNGADPDAWRYGGAPEPKYAALVTDEPTAEEPEHTPFRPELMEYDEFALITTDNDGIVSDPYHPMHGLKHRIINGQDVFIARETDPGGRKKVWYTFAKRKGFFRRWEDKGYGPDITTVPEITEQYIRSG